MADEFESGVFRTKDVTIKTNVPRSLRKKSIGEIARKHYKIAQEKTVRYGRDTLKVEIKNSNKVASGRLLNSVTSNYVEGRKNSGFNFQSSLTFDSPGSAYAGFANLGRGPDKNPPNPVGSADARPFKGISPMVQAISQWMDDKHIPQKYLFYIVRTIKYSGTDKKNPGNKFMQRAQKRIKDKALENALAAEAAIKEEMNS